MLANTLSPAYLLLIVAILFGVTGQILLKTGMTRHPDFRLADLPALVFSPYLAGGFASYLISTVLYVKALASLDLSLAYPTVSLGYVLIALLSRIFFRESVSLARWAAIMMICAGVALVGFGVQ